MSYSVDAVVIGAGVVGLAVARKLAQQGLETIVLEKDATYGQGISSRNSEVIHAGLYYKPDSLKARLCKTGREMLYHYCAERHVPHQQVGKWVVATHAGQVETLQSIYDRALTNGCDEVYLMDGEQAVEIEPHLNAHKVLVSPRTGIVDSHGLMTALLGDLEAAGGMALFYSPVMEIVPGAKHHLVKVGGREPAELTARIVVNSAGLGAPNLARHLPDAPKGCFAKGNYFSLQGKSPFSRLIYPIPEAGGLGTHLTLDLQGRAKFGPDVQWVGTEDYRVEESRKSRFAEAIRSYWPQLDEARLTADYSGIRPKLGSPEHFADDFKVLSEADHGYKGLVHLLGIESPGLTSCLAIAECLKLG